MLIRIMGEHKFYDKDLSDNTWMVRCSDTGGSFSTELWRTGKFPSQRCPCCDEIIKTKKRKGK